MRCLPFLWNIDELDSASHFAPTVNKEIAISEPADTTTNLVGHSVLCAKDAESSCVELSIPTSNTEPVIAIIPEPFLCFGISTPTDWRKLSWITGKHDMACPQRRSSKCVHDGHHRDFIHHHDVELAAIHVFVQNHLCQGASDDSNSWKNAWQQFGGFLICVGDDKHQTCPFDFSTCSYAHSVILREPQRCDPVPRQNYKSLVVTSRTMAMRKAQIARRHRIASMVMWDQDFIDTDIPG